MMNVNRYAFSCIAMFSVGSAYAVVAPPPPQYTYSFPYSVSVTAETELRDLYVAASIKADDSNYLSGSPTHTDFKLTKIADLAPAGQPITSNGVLTLTMDAPLATSPGGGQAFLTIVGRYAQPGGAEGVSLLYQDINTTNQLLQFANSSSADTSWGEQTTLPTNAFGGDEGAVVQRSFDIGFTEAQALAAVKAGDLEGLMSFHYNLVDAAYPVYLGADFDGNTPSGTNLFANEPYKMVNFSNASLGGSGTAALTVTPEPAGLSLLAVGSLSLLKRRRTTRA